MPKRTRTIEAEAPTPAMKPNTNVRTLSGHNYRSSKPHTRSTSKISVCNPPSEDDTDTKPLPSFNGALESFAFKPAARLTAANPPSTPPLPRTTRRTPRKRSPSTSPLTSAPPSPTTPPPSSNRKTKKPKHRGYAPPSVYAHLPHLPQTTAPNLILLFIGTNPGLATAATAHAYAAPSNLFWRLLHTSGLTPDRKLHPAEHITLPERYSLGNTNLVARPTKDQAELSRAEMEASVGALEERVRACRPEAVAVVGKGVWERVVRGKTGRGLRADGFAFGWQEGWRLGAGEGWEGARVFVAVSTSGLVAGYSLVEKERIFAELGEWVQWRRRERGECAPRKVEEGVLREVVKRRLREWARGEAVRVREEGGDVAAVEETVGRVLRGYGVEVEGEEVKEEGGVVGWEPVRETGDAPVKEEKLAA